MREERGLQCVCPARALNPSWETWDGVDRKINFFKSLSKYQLAFFKKSNTEIQVDSNRKFTISSAPFFPSHAVNCLLLTLSLHFFTLFFNLDLSVSFYKRFINFIYVFIFD